MAKYKITEKQFNYVRENINKPFPPSKYGIDIPKNTSLPTDDIKLPSKDYGNEKTVDIMLKREQLVNRVLDRILYLPKDRKNEFIGRLEEIFNEFNVEVPYK
jgi:hypothetical protein